MGFNRYEISNYSKNEKIAKHNTAYWQRKNYIGIGPSAHSFRNRERQWNISNNALYIGAITGDLPYFESEELSDVDIANEIIMTGLRTKWGLNLDSLREIKGIDLASIFSRAQEWLTSGHMKKENGYYKLTDRGFIISDHIASELFYDSE